MPIRIWTAEAESTFLTQGFALKTVLERDPLLAPVEVRESVHASIENAQRLARAPRDFGFMAANWIGRAKRGEPPFLEPIDLSMVAPMNAGPLFFITPAQSPVRSLADLPGRRVVVGAEKSGMAQHAQAILQALGIGFADFTPIYLDFAAGAEALAAGKAEIQLQCPIPNRVMTALSERILLRVLPYTPAQLATLLEAIPYYRRTMIRKGAFRGLDADSEQPAVVNVLVTHASNDDAPVAAVAKGIFAGAEELGTLNHLFQGLAGLFVPLRSQGAAALEFGGVTLHPGALAAYREVGLLP